MDVKDEDKSEESKQNHIIYYNSLTKIIKNMENEIDDEGEPAVKEHLKSRIDAIEKDRQRIEICFQIGREKNGMTTPTEKNHNKHLDLLHDYKIHLVRQVQELEKMDKKSEFLKKWNEETVKDRKKEIQIIDKILKNVIRF